MRSTTENLIKTMSKKIIYSHLVENSSEYLSTILAPDVYYLGAVKNMQAEGRKKVEFFLSRLRPHIYPTTITQEKYLTKRLGGEHWLCEATCDIELQKSETEKSLECLHETLVFRRRKDAKAGQSEWELIYVHIAITSTLHSPSDMLAIKQETQNRKRPNIYEGMTDREIRLVRMLRRGMSIRDMAQEFGQAEITIKKALAKLYKRYDRKNRSRLCAYFDALEHDY